MLLLTRKENEEIVIPQYGITVRPVEVKGKKVRLGITAPSDVEVYRREVWDRMQAEGNGASDTSLQPLAGPHILIVEDNPDCRWGLETLLKVLGYRVESAGDGLEGLEMALRDKPPVLLVDINMPGMDGLELARRVRKQPGFERATLVAVTGSSDFEDGHLPPDSGFDACLSKPVDLAELQAVLAQLHLTAA